MKYYSAIKKKEIMPFAATWMDLEGITLSEINQTNKDKYCMISLISGNNKNTNLKRYMHLSVHSSTIYSSQDIEAT